jgi:CheY-like chemotaxis protein
MDGVEATGLIRAAEAAQGLRRTPIIALSANAFSHQVNEYLAAGMDAHVAKPIELSALAAALELAVDGADDESQEAAVDYPRQASGGSK